MGKFSACVPTALTTASTLVVATSDALCHGVVILSGATATAGAVVVRATNTTGAPVCVVSAALSGGAAQGGPTTPVVCAGGMVAVCTGTAFNYTVLYSYL